MPNGGSDCCETCWFNAKNEGEPGYDHVDDPEPDYCTIRDLRIEGALNTYCANHPHRRPNRDPIPIGPVFTGDDDGPREIWKDSPDTEEVRRHLLDLLGEMEEEPRSEYPLGIYCDELVVWQLGEFREARAVEALRRVASFRPRAAARGPFGRTREGLVQIAREALDKIRRGGA